MKAKAYLLQIQKLDIMIRNKREEQQHWLHLAMSTTSSGAPDTGVRVQSSGSQQRMADAVDRSIDIGAGIYRSIRRLYQIRQEIIGVIEQLDVMEYDLLHKLYVGKISEDALGMPWVHYMTLQEAADAIGKSYSWATTLHGVALKKVQRIIDAQQVAPVEELLQKWREMDAECEKL